MSDFVMGVIASSMRISLPLILCALGGMYCERVGVINIGLEGIMVLGAFFGIYGSYLFSSAWMGLLFAIAFGAVIGLVHGVLTVKFHTNHVIGGVAINLLGEGLSVLLLVLVWGNKGKSTEVAGFRTLSSILPKRIPVISDLFGNLTVLFLIMAALIAISYIHIFKSPSGLRIRAIGDNPEVADTMGINVERTQILFVVVGSVLGAISGACLSIGDIHYFSRGMVAGRGFMAMAAMVFGMWHPVFILLGGFFFGLIQTVQMRLQAFDIPVQFVQMLPYVVTVLTLVFTSRSDRGPRNVGKPFIRGARE